MPARESEDKLEQPLRDLLVRVWRAAGPLQGWLAWRLSARFGVGVTGIVRSADGQVLLLRHRLWPDDTQWGFPSGFAKRGERYLAAGRLAT